MATLTFDTLQFSDNPDFLKVDFLRMFQFKIDRKDLASFGEMKVTRESLEFPSMAQGACERKFNRLMSKGFLNLTNRLNGKPTVYVHRGSGIPLRGYIAFGLIDRGSNVIEVKPITSCNVACTYCSVSEDVRPVDFVVEVEYLVEEFKKLVDEKGCDEIEAHISSQGEPFLYDDMLLLVKKISALPQVKYIATDTNATTLTVNKVNELIDAGFTRFNVSINAIDPLVAKKIANAPYNIEHVKDISKHIAEHPKCDLCISPTFIPGLNEEEMPKIIGFAKSLVNPNWKFKMGIQNFLEYQFGRNPATQMPWDEFFEKLKKWEKEFGVQLMLKEEDFSIVKSAGSKKVFKRGEIVKAEIKCRGRLPGEKIAVARGFCISLPRCHQTAGMVKVKITKTKHNLYSGQVV